MTSNCAGQPAGCTVNSAHRVRRRQLPARATSSTKSRNLFDAGHLHREAAGVSPPTSRTTSASTSRLTVNARPALGRLRAVGRDQDERAVELRRDDRHSSSSPRTTRRSTASRSAATCRPTRRRDFGPRLRLRLRPHRQRQDARPRRLRRVLELHARRHLVVEGAEPAVPAVDGADADADGLRRQPAAQGRPAGAAGRRSRRAPAAGATRSIFDIDFRDAYARQWNVNVQRGSARNYMVEAAYVGSQGRQMRRSRSTSNQAPPVVGVTDSNVNRPFIDARAGAADRRPGRRASARSTTTACW